MIIDFDQGSEIDRQEICLENFSLDERVNLMKKMTVNVIICCAISEVADHMIKGTKIQLICGIVGDVNQVLSAYLSNRLNESSFHMPGYNNTQ